MNSTSSCGVLAIFLLLAYVDSQRAFSRSQAPEVANKSA